MTTTFSRTALNDSDRAIAFLNAYGVDFQHQKIAYEVKAQIVDRFYWHNSRNSMNDKDQAILLDELLQMPSSELLLIAQTTQTVVQVEQSSSLRYREIQAAMQNKTGSGNTLARTRSGARVRTAS